MIPLVRSVAAVLWVHRLAIAIAVFVLGVVAAWLGAPSWCAAPTALAAFYLIVRFDRWRGGF